MLGSPTSVLVGRDAERVVMAAFVDSVSRGLAGLLIEGAAGIGKSALVAAVVADARVRGHRVAMCRPTEAEASYAYAGLADLFDGMPMPQNLPAPQRRALEIALRRTDVDTAPVDAHLVALAAREVLAAQSAVAPLLVVVDDLPWLDPPSATVLAFATRRLTPCRVGVLLARRADHAGDPPWRLDGNVDSPPWCQIWLRGLAPSELHDLIRARLGTSLARSTVHRLHEMCQGNPFHALQIAQAMLDRGELEPADEAWPVPPSLQALVADRLTALKENDREVLLVLAAMAAPSVDRLRAAFRDIEPRRSDVDAVIDRAESAGLVTAAGGGRIGFTHPLYASVIYREASGPVRRAAHRRLAIAEPELEARARHLALATVGRDAAVAANLERAAGDAALRGATDVAADLLRLSRARTPGDDAEAFGRRTVALADAMFDAGDLAAAIELLDGELPRLPAGALRARARMTRGTVAWFAGSAAQARELLLEALDDAAEDPVLLGQLHGRLAVFYESDARLACHHASVAVEALDAAGDKELLAAALCNLFYSSVLAGEAPRLELLARGLELEDAQRHVDQSTTPGFWYLALDEWDLARARFSVQLQRSRESGDVSTEADMLTRLGEVELLADDWAAARAYAEQAAAATRELGLSFDASARLALQLAALEGRIDEVRASARDMAAEHEAANEALLATAYLGVLAFASASIGDVRAVIEAGDRAATHFAAIGIREPLSRPDPFAERAEALAVEGRDAEAAAAALADLTRRHDLIPRPWLEAAICRTTAELAAARGDLDAALTATDPAVDDRSSRWRRFDRARTLLVRGRTLRRARRSGAAAECLATARDIFAALGAAEWLSRTEEETARLGRRRTGGDRLNDTELAVARLAAGGATNRDMATALHMSPKTVEAHLSRVYRKLNIRSRGELGRIAGAGGLA